MQLVELQERYFREPAVNNEKSTKQGLFNKVAKLFDNKDEQESRRKSFLSDSNYSDDLEKQTKKPKDKPKSILNGIVNDWVFLFVLGVGMALFSSLMEWTIRRVGDVHILTLIILDSVDPDEDGIGHFIAEYVLWVVFAVSMTMISSTIARYISKESIGSGVPEMKTVLRGGIVENYLNFRALIAVFFGLTFASGAGMPIGKAGPYIHFSSIIAKLIGQQIFTFDENASVTNSKLTELLAVAPIGGVLFAIEVTSVHFSVQNYWRSFFSAVSSTAILRLVTSLLEGDSEAGALFPTSFPDNAFFPEEMVFFVFLGIICGVLGILFVKLHRSFVLIRRNNSIVKKIFDLHWTLYPVFISTIVALLTYPEGYGRLIGGERTFAQSVEDFFANCTWAAKPNDTNYCPDMLRKDWLNNGELNAYLVLFCFASTYFILTALAATLPIPNGLSIPVGASVGRLLGELLARAFPDGVRNDHNNFIYPGIYSVVGASALYGSVTDTVSASLIIVELTGQLTAGLPALIATLISTAIRGYYELSFFESLIQLKSLPTLPPIPPSSKYKNVCHGILVEQFMEKRVSKLTPKSTYADVRKILDEETNVKVVPVIDNYKSKLLIGTCHRNHLEQAVNQLISNEKRHTEAERRVRILQKVFNYRYKKFTVVRVAQTRGWKIAKEAVADKRVHKLAMQLDLVQAHEEGNQEGKKKRLKKLVARKIADVSGKALPDLYGENRWQWEEEQLKDVIDLKLLEIDTAPFRLIVGTSLLNVYNLFSLLCLNRAYVTKHGCLIGVVSLAEIHQAVNDIHNGLLFPLPKRPQERSSDEDLNVMKNFNVSSFRRLARQSIVQFMETDENPWINRKWSQNIASGMESKHD
ncbi:hypothetical protein M3Y97_00115900 [Aphelenchoides bicaudatus]|nr:hypothetical protein M3Y97_00115900 [Aphelenchoides bicaudatus]